jgi:hypothetical protein
MTHLFAAYALYKLQGVDQLNKCMWFAQYVFRYNKYYIFLMNSHAV